MSLKPWPTGDDDHDYKTMIGMAESCLKPEAGGVKPKVEHQFLWIVL